MGTISEWFNRGFASIKRGKLSRGQYAERLAEKYLKQHGLKLKNRNFFTKAGEIDLVMADGDSWIFVEVRYKSSDEWANPAESITPQKQRKIIKAAQYYLQKFDKSGKKPCRFDVILMSGDLNSPQIEWLEHAFY